MKNTILFLVIVAAVRGQQATNTNMELVSAAGITLSLEYVDPYVFRGRVLDSESSYQGEFTVGIASWSYSIFHHRESEDNPLAWEELNHSIEYTTVAGNSIQTIGYRYYDITTGLADSELGSTQELFYRVSQQSSWHPTYGVAIDIERYRGYYADFSVSHPFQLTRRSFLTFDIEVGLSQGLEEKTEEDAESGEVRVVEPGFYGKEGLNHGACGLSWSWSIHRRLNLSVTYEYHRAFDDLLKNDPMTGKQTQVWRAALKVILP